MRASAGSSFLTPSGVDEFPSVGERSPARAAVLARAAQGRCRLLVHAEDPRLLRDADGSRSYTTFRDPPGCGRGCRHRTYRHSGRRVSCPDAHRPCVVGGRARRRIEGARARHDRHCGNLPSLSDVRGRSDSGRRHRLQRAPPISRIRRPRCVVARPPQRRVPPGGERSLPAPPAMKAVGLGRLSGRVGRHQVSRSVTGSGVGPAPRRADSCRPMSRGG